MVSIITTYEIFSVIKTTYKVISSTKTKLPINTISSLILYSSRNFSCAFFNSPGLKVST